MLPLKRLVYYPLMVWQDSIDDIEYYNNDPRVACYHDYIITPTDILLQGQLPIVAQGYSLIINVLTPSGVFIENATTFFSYYFALALVGNVNPITLQYFNIQGNLFSSGMLSNVCFILEVIVKDANSITVFHKFTEAYQLTENAGVYPTNITIDQNGVSLDAVICETPSLSACTPNLLKFVSKAECYDSLTGDYYGLPTQVFGGAYSTQFQFYKQSYIQACIRKKPTEIKRTISLNCRTQKTEITPLLELRGQTLYPGWKKDEIEYMFMGNHLYFDDIEYQSIGGTPFTDAYKKPYVCCIYHYILAMPLNKCYEFNIFGCNDCTVQTTGAKAYYVVMKQPASGTYFDDNNQKIAYDSDSLLTYFQGRNEVVTAIDDTDISVSMQCKPYLIVGVSGGDNLPSYIQVDGVGKINRVYAQYLTGNQSLNNLCGNLSTSPCDTPILGTTSVISLFCTAPTLGAHMVIVNPMGVVTVTGAGFWTVNSGTITKGANDIVTMSVVFRTTHYVIGSPTIITNELIGQLNYNATPENNQTFSADTSPGLPAGSTLIIIGKQDTTGNAGKIYYSGIFSSQTSINSTLTINNINYIV